jgi:uncharacterized membrane protein (UPF0127 family)
VSPDDHRLKILLGIALVLIGAGVWAFLLRGADGPDDPSLGEPVGEAGTTATPLPGEPNRVRLDGFDELAITVDPGDGSLLSWCVLAALTSEQRAQGLMEVTDLQGYSGMVFVYEEDVQNDFYMRNTPTPLSIAWIAADGSVVTITDMAPCEDREGCPTYEPEGSYRYALEVFQGDLPALGITESSKVTVGGTCAPTT